VVVVVDSPRRTLAWLDEHGHKLPPTVSVKTARGQHHYYYLPDDCLEVRSKDIKNLNGVVVFEVKANGSQVVARQATYAYRW
jgi:hypothetical protein